MVRQTSTKGAQTRQRVVELSAPLFNRRGYLGASLSEVMAATGLEKGGIYNHFSSKDELALAAFDHNVEIISSRIRAAIAADRHASRRLVGIIDAYREFAAHPPIPGGCPLLNTAVEADDTHPRLRERVRDVLDDLRGTIHRIVERGIERGELRTGVEPDVVATVMVAGLEGAQMLSGLYRDNSPMERTADHLVGFVESLTVTRRARRAR